MKILLVGNLGYVGAVAAPCLVNARPRDTIDGFDSALFASCLSDNGFVPESYLNSQKFGDVRNMTEEDFKGYDAIVYLAAVSNDPMGKMFEEATYQINRDSAVKLAKLAKCQGVKKFVFASSCSVYGAGGEGAKTEESQLNPLTAYAKSKVETEDLLEEVSDEGFRVVCLRFATACGFSSRVRLDLVLNDFVASAFVKGKIEILSDGSPWRPLIHVEDMGRAMDWALGFEEEEFVSVNTGSDDWNYQIKDLALAVADKMQGVDVSINSNASPDSRSYRVDFGKFRELAPNHQPQVDLTAAIVGLHSGFKQMGFADGDFRNSHFMRLKYLEFLRERDLIDSLLFKGEKS